MTSDYAVTPPSESGLNWSGEVNATLTSYSLTHTLVTTTLLGVIILLTIVGNVFVIAAIILERNLHSVANYLVASLAVADLMVAALVMPLAAFKETTAQWLLGRDVCDMWVFFDVLCCTSSILHLLAIALDRYWAVTRIEYMRNRTARRILLMVGLSWTLSICISIPLLIGWKTDDVSVAQCIISQDWTYTVFSTVGAFYLPSLLMLILYIRIYQVAKSSIRKKRFRKKTTSPPPLTATTEVPTSARTSREGRRPDPPGGHPTPAARDANGGGDTATNGAASVAHLPVAYVTKPGLSPPLSPPLSPGLSPPLSPSPCCGEEHKTSLLDITKGYFERKRASPPPRQRAKEKQELKRERKAARTLSIITGAFICSWLPFFVVATVMPFCGKSCSIPPLVESVISWLGYFNSFLNPIIYTIFSPDFRLAFRKILFGKYKARARR